MTWTFPFLEAVQLAVHDVKNPAPKVYPIQCLIQGEHGREMESGAMINVYQPTGDEFPVVFVLVKFQGFKGLFEVSLEGILLKLFLHGSPQRFWNGYENQD